MFRTLVFSGLAAVGAVVIVPMLVEVVPAPAEEVPNGAQNGAQSAAQAEPEAPSLSTIFNLSENTFGFVLAATFGLSPELLVNMLKQQGEKLKDKLKSTEPATTDAD